MEERTAPTSQAVQPHWKFLVLFAVLPLIAGILLSLLIPRPVVGVIYLNSEIYSTSAQDMIEQLIYAREHNEIRAVVLVVNSPGGTVSDTESVYLEIMRLRESKPVVTMIESMAASGGYYLAAGTDYILAKASSQVGNVGVVTTLPSEPLIFENIYSTGPYKLWGSPRDHAMREAEALKEGFWQVVLLGRGERLLVSREIILRGQLWLGAEAQQLGLVDAIGPQSMAFDKAAELAKIAHYKTENLRMLSGLSVTVPFFFGESGQSSLKSESVLPPPGIYYLHIPFLEVAP